MSSRAYAVTSRLCPRRYPIPASSAWLANRSHASGNTAPTVSVIQSTSARLVVVTAYRDGGSGASALPAAAHRDVYGVEAARKALETSVTGLTRERARYIEQRLVAGDPAQALLDTVGSNPANLIVVGNRGLGATEGELLGSVVRNVVRKASCDVLVVQTSALDEERLFRAEPTAAAAF